MQHDYSDVAEIYSSSGLDDFCGVSSLALGGEIWRNLERSCQRSRVTLILRGYFPLLSQPGQWYFTRPIRSQIHNDIWIPRIWGLLCHLSVLGHYLPRPTYHEYCFQKLWSGFCDE